MKLYIAHAGAVAVIIALTSATQAAPVPITSGAELHVLGASSQAEPLKVQKDEKIQARAFEPVEAFSELVGDMGKVINEESRSSSATVSVSPITQYLSKLRSQRGAKRKHVDYELRRDLTQSSPLFSSPLKKHRLLYSSSDTLSDSRTLTSSTERTRSINFAPSSSSERTLLLRNLRSRPPKEHARRSGASAERTISLSSSSSEQTRSALNSPPSRMRSRPPEWFTTSTTTTTATTRDEEAKPEVVFQNWR